MTRMKKCTDPIFSLTFNGENELFDTLQKAQAKMFEFFDDYSKNELAHNKTIVPTIKNNEIIIDGKSLFKISFVPSIKKAIIKDFCYVCGLDKERRDREIESFYIFQELKSFVSAKMDFDDFTWYEPMEREKIVFGAVLDVVGDGIDMTADYDTTIELINVYHFNSKRKDFEDELCKLGWNIDYENSNDHCLLVDKKDVFATITCEGDETCYITTMSFDNLIVTIPREKKDENGFEKHNHSDEYKVKDDDGQMSNDLIVKFADITNNMAELNSSIKEITEKQGKLIEKQMTLLIELASHK